MTRKRILTACAPALTLLICGIAAADEFLVESPIHQLRIYEVPGENRGPFHERFRDHAAGIMTKYEFDIIAMWESHFEDRTEFVYLLEWPDRRTMTEQWDAFMADEEWKSIKRETGRAHGTFVESIEDRTLVLTDYSPATTLLDHVADAASM